jgi:curli biogenesis system outer membrane secretion channel CsgG
MNPNFIALILAASVLCSSIAGRAQDMDKELQTLAEKAAAAIKEQGKKKVTVLDFTDLDGNSTRLGRSVAEEIEVNLVMTKRDFSVLDRANLRKILAEHKLTATGLIDPENAKKIGMFAGVDTLILGTLGTKGTNSITATAKLITVDTAEISSRPSG